MKLAKWFLTFAILLTVTAAATQAGPAKLQVIHNAADPAAAEVDIYINGELKLDNFAFREATPFIEIPASTPIEIGVAGPTSGSADDTLASFTVTFAPDKKYVAIANGVLGSSFADNPDGESIGFTIFSRDDMRTRAKWWFFTDIIAFHGATDAPTVNIRVRGLPWGPLFEDLTYGEFSHYRSVFPAEYVLDVTVNNGGGDDDDGEDDDGYDDDKDWGDNDETVVASFKADLRGLRGGAAVVFASGFLNPAANSDGPAFGLFAALPDGTVVPLPAKEAFAKLQVIHNAADPAADTVDVWVNGEKLIPNFAFRTATPYVTVPANTPLTIGVAPKGSASQDESLKQFDVTLAPDKKYVAMANGVVGSGFASNPDGKDIAFTLFTRDGMQEKSRLRRLVKLIAFHGATDAPAVDIVAKRDWYLRTVANDLGYGDFGRYGYFLPKAYELFVTLADDRETVVAKFNADLSGLRGQAATVFASGFLTPADNNDGPAFGLFAALADGQVVELPQIIEEQFARLQVIHNAADPAADTVDVWVNDTKLLPNFAFRTATPFIDVPAGVELIIGVAPQGSSDQSESLAQFPVTLDANEKYIVFANGVVGNGFQPNPDGRSIAFTLITKPGAREAGENGSGLVDFFALHGATDAPMVDVVARGVATLADDIAYGDTTGYISVPANSYILDVTPGGDNSTVLVSYTADLSGLGGGAAAVFASGFYTPGDDQNGSEFGLFAALPNGVVVEFPMTSARSGALASANSLGLPEDFELSQNYPNPFNPSTNIEFALPVASDVELTIYNTLGQEVTTLVNQFMEAGTHAVEFDASRYASGIYFYRLSAETFTDTKKMILIK